MESVFETVNHQEKTLPERVANQIVQLTIDQKLNSNDKLPNEFELAAQLNVGRGTIREAVKLLVSRNILEIRRGKGTYICSQPGQIKDPFGLTYIANKHQLARDIMELRIQIEPWAASLAAVRASDEERRRIEDSHKAMEAEILAGRSHLALDMAFHNYIAQDSHNIMVPKLLPVIGTYVQLAGNIGDAMETIREHRAIVDAITAGDGDMAFIAMKKHLSSAQEVLQVSPVNFGGEYF